jgi:hypothetical protein
VPRLDGADERPPADPRDDEEGHDEDPRAHDDELEPVRDEHGQHPAEDRVREDDEQEPGHRDLEQPGIEARDDDQELAADPQEEAHVQEPAEEDHEAGREADPLPEALLEELGDRRDARFPQGRHAESGRARPRASPRPAAGRASRPRSRSGSPPAPCRRT